MQINVSLMQQALSYVPRESVQKWEKSIYHNALIIGDRDCKERSYRKHCMYV